MYIDIRLIPRSSIPLIDQRLNFHNLGRYTAGSAYLSPDWPANPIGTELP